MLTGPHALYVGMTDNFADRIPTHERWAEAVRRGATHVYALPVVDAMRRLGLEALMIRQLQPPMNAQQPTLLGLGAIAR